MYVIFARCLIYLLVLRVNEKKYVGGQIKELILDVSIKFGDEIFYRISGINSAEFDLVLRSLYNVKPFIFAFVNNNQEDLQFLLTSDDVS